jgi:hypothetical protein
LTVADGFATPSEAAPSGFPKRYARVADVTFSEDGNEATVELLTNEEPTLYPYFSHCVRDGNGRWHEIHSHN